MRGLCRMWALLAIVAQALLLSGCGTPQMEFDSADAAKEALNTAEHIEIYCDLYTPSSKTEIVADGKVAGYLKGQTVYIDGEKWFSIDYVTDEPINNVEGRSSSTTFGYYDADGNCLGYAQKQYLDTTDGGREEFLVFMDADGDELDYYSTNDGSVLFDADGNAVGTGYAGKKNIGYFRRVYTNVYRTEFDTDPGAQMYVYFMDRMAMFQCLQEDIRLVYEDPVNTVVEIIVTVIVLIVIIFTIIDRIAKHKKKKNTHQGV